MIITDFKRCSRCKQHKLDAEFNRTCHTRDGRAPWCRQCEKEYRKTHGRVRKKLQFAAAAVKIGQTESCSASHVSVLTQSSGSE